MASLSRSTKMSPFKSSRRMPLTVASSALLATATLCSLPHRSTASDEKFLSHVDSLDLHSGRVARAVVANRSTRMGSRAITQSNLSIASTAASSADARSKSNRAADLRASKLNKAASASTLSLVSEPPVKKRPAKKPALGVASKLYQQKAFAAADERQCMERQVDACLEGRRPPPTDNLVLTKFNTARNHHYPNVSFDEDQAGVIRERAVDMKYYLDKHRGSIGPDAKTLLSIFQQPSYNSVQLDTLSRNSQLLGKPELLDRIATAPLLPETINKTRDLLFCAITGLDEAGRRRLNNQLKFKMLLHSGLRKMGPSFRMEMRRVATDRLGVTFPVGSKFSRVMQALFGKCLGDASGKDMPATIERMRAKNLGSTGRHPDGFEQLFADAMSDFFHYSRFLSKDKKAKCAADLLAAMNEARSSADQSLKTRLVRRGVVDSLIFCNHDLIKENFHHFRDIMFSDPTSAKLDFLMKNRKLIKFGKADGHDTPLHILAKGDLGDELDPRVVARFTKFVAEANIGTLRRIFCSDRKRRIAMVNGEGLTVEQLLRRKDTANAEVVAAVLRKEPVKLIRDSHNLRVNFLEATLKGKPLDLKEDAELAYVRYTS